MPPRDYYLPERRLVHQDAQAVIQSTRVPRSKFLGRKTRKTAFNAGQIIPIHWDIILPGDHMKYTCIPYVRLSTPVFPMMDNMRIDTHWFFIPMRLLWENWPKFMGEQKTPGASINYTLPVATSKVAGYDVASLQDHFGHPTVGQIAAGETYTHQNLPPRAYNLVFNEWFRDENNVLPSAEVTGDGPDTYTDFVIRYRAKSHDYFTKALPWAQKFTAPTVPVAGNAPVKGLGILAGTAIQPTTAPGGFMETDNVGPVVYPAWFDIAGLIAGQGGVRAGTVSGLPEVYADLSVATGVSINVFRQAFMVQELLERDARGGTRYTESIRAHFDVISPDFRLQRPEYIGGGQTPLQITPIAQTAPSLGATVGALGGTGTAAGRHFASYAATEHGIILGLLSVRSELSYQQGLHRFWNISTRYDFYFPEFAGLGEQAILRQELYMTGAAANDSTVFGYNERWQEYREMYSDVTGIMRSNAVGTLDPWHLAQNFTAAPTLNEDFIADLPPMARVLAAGALANNQQFIADILIEREAIRPIPTFGTPATLGRF